MEPDRGIKGKLQSEAPGIELLEEANWISRALFMMASEMENGLWLHVLADTGLGTLLVSENNFSSQNPLGSVMLTPVVRSR